jgi:hypothetical protein
MEIQVYRQMSNSHRMDNRDTNQMSVLTHLAKRQDKAMNHTCPASFLQNKTTGSVLVSVS